MHVDAKKIATAGLLAACAVLLVVLGAVIETNSLFLIAAASFCVGIAIREWGLRMGAGFLTACVCLNGLLAPNKLYGITFAAMGIYIWMSELLWEKIADAKRLKRRKSVLWFGKYVIFNCMYIPVMVFFPALFFTKKLADSMTVVLFFAGQIGLLIFDKAYVYFQGYVWGKLRRKLMK